MNNLEALMRLDKGGFKITKSRYTVDGVRGVLRFGDTDKFEISISKVLDVPKVDERAETVRRVEALDYDTLCDIEVALSLLAPRHSEYEYKLFCVRKRIEELDEEWRIYNKEGDK